MNRKAQAWVIDFMIAIFIFSTCLVIYYKTIPNIKMKFESPIDEVYLDAKTVSGMLMSSGTPNDWNVSNVKRIGILAQNNIVDSEKVLLFSNMTIFDYDKTRTVFGIKSDFITYFIDMNNNFIDIENTGVIGNLKIAQKPITHTNITEIGAKNIIKIERLLLYNQSPIKMVVYTWN